MTQSRRSDRAYVVRLLAVLLAVVATVGLTAPATAVPADKRGDKQVVRVWHAPVTPTTISGSGLAAVRTYFTPITVDGVATGGYLTGTLTTVAYEASTDTEWRTSNLVFVMGALADQVVVGGVLTYPPASATLTTGTPYVRPVLGGAGAYAGARGYVTSVNRGADGWLHVFHLRY